MRAGGRRWSWRPGGRVAFLVLVIMAVVPEKSGPGAIPGGNLVEDFYGAANTLRNGPGRAARAGSGFTYPGRRPPAPGPRRGPAGTEVDARRPRPGSPKGDAPRHCRSYPEGVSDYRKQPAMRVYVPLTLPGLAEAHKAGEVGPAPLRAYAVTPGLREWYVSEDIEELEYAALGQAAAASLRMLAEDGTAPRKRVVVALDVDDKAATAAPGADEESPGLVTLAGAVRLTVAAAVHVDAPQALEDVTAAAAAVPAADAGDGDAQSAVDGAEDHELLWFGVQEIPGLLK